MKKTDEQLQQEVAEIRRFVNGDSKQTAKKVIPSGRMSGMQNIAITRMRLRILPKLRAEIRLE